MDPDRVPLSRTSCVQPWLRGYKYNPTDQMPFPYLDLAASQLSAAATPRDDASIARFHGSLAAEMS